MKNSCCDWSAARSTVLYVWSRRPGGKDGHLNLCWRPSLSLRHGGRVWRHVVSLFATPPPRDPPALVTKATPSPPFQVPQMSLFTHGTEHSGYFSVLVHFPHLWYSTQWSWKVEWPLEIHVLLSSRNRARSARATRQQGVALCWKSVHRISRISGRISEV